jgi:phage terminase large subunit-like protein
MPYDPWQATQLAQTINEQARGIPVEFRNTVGNMSPAFWELLAAIESGRLHHPDNPILNWHASNVTAREDAKGNIFPRKELPESKIDGIVAAIMGIGRASVRQQKRSVYESRGLI